MQNQRQAIIESGASVTAPPPPLPVARASNSSATNSPSTDRPRRRTFKEQQELDQLPRRLEQLEREQRELQETMSSPGFYQKDKSTIAQATKRLEDLGNELSKTFERWELLESLSE